MQMNTVDDRGCCVVSFITSANFCEEIGGNAGRANLTINKSVLAFHKFACIFLVVVINQAVYNLPELNCASAAAFCKSAK